MFLVAFGLILPPCVALLCTTPLWLVRTIRGRFLGHRKTPNVAPPPASSCGGRAFERPQKSGLSAVGTVASVPGNQRTFSAQTTSGN
jgi:hypothetical protein